MPEVKQMAMYPLIFVIIFSTYRLKRDHDKADYHYRAAKQARAHVVPDI